MKSGFLLGSPLLLLTVAVAPVCRTAPDLCKEYAVSREYDKAIELNPAYAIAYYNRAIAHSKKNHHDETIADYRKAIELSPEDPVALVGRAVAITNKKRRDHGVPEAGAAADPAPAKPPPSIAGAVIPSRSAASAPPAERQVSPLLPVQAPAGATVTPEGAKGTYSVQLGAFRNEDNALRLAGQLKGKGYARSS